MQAVLNINKADLVAKLEERIEEFSAPYDEFFDEIDDYMSKILSASDHRTKLSEWHAKIAAGLESGAIEISAKNRLIGAPPRPTETSYINIKITTPDGRNYGTDRYPYRCDLDSLKQVKSSQEKVRDSLIQPIQAALNLLELSVEDVVTINAADYHALLSAS